MKLDYFKPGKISLFLLATIFSVNVFAVNSVKIKSMTDSSGKIEVAVFERVSGQYLGINIDFGIDVADDFVVIGGGVEGANYPTGNLITASYPNHNLSSWLVSSKDHKWAQAIKIKGYAIGLKVQGLSRAQLLNYISVNSNTSGWVPHPDVSVGVPSGHLLIGGGMKVNWSGAGNLATGSYPSNTFSWRARSKDHLVGSYAQTVAYAIGIKDYIPGVGSIYVDINTGSSAYTGHPASSANVQPGYALTGCGANVNWSGWGNLLWKIKPFTQLNQHGCEVSSKDHGKASPATIDSYALSIQVR